MLLISLRPINNLLDSEKYHCVTPSEYRHGENRHGQYRRGEYYHGEYHHGENRHGGY